MELLILALAASCFFSMCTAIPANNRLEERQRDKTYTITCLGPSCTDYPPTSIDLPTTFPSIPNPGGPDPKPTTTPKSSSALTSKKTTFTSKNTPPPPPPATSKYTPPSPPPTSKYTPPPPPPTSKYTPPPQPPTKSIKTSQEPTKTGGEVGPSSTRCPVPLYYQCGGYYGGKPWTGCTKCVSGAECVTQNEWYDQCVAKE
ncbi:hypothetical protein BS50DRAFT_84370 [Corynespora cassiicola Philippines]|uniref:CBM1 domain-containing protein n=1 Tax=Corynespora cassiicola Philippines TaxID=1448308 RepID=A0A2T2NDQ8_CORCC|nr:hypothetical protein BS50DRAFT_84370 [Corynespora cassiicola Philippines]